ncbi:hypothetical protein FA15DRAFT_663082 [Coprinopsis marcescibilis]|uniref:DUF6533 domain-containing protein n=1 Tax=Coprinopsis marcescibilis TaxID=230819 RepID=A0A5C3LM75_COPMA|nr:hypothetical protein FA15DRAFT_663082 [Coprinopsis marcescibilis]
MSGLVAANYAAAEWAAQTLGLKEEEKLVTAAVLGLLHVLQVYTSAMVAIAVWDWLTCLKMEWECIWKKEWSLIKGLYLWTRYYGLLCFSLNLWLFNDNFTEERCKTLHYLIAATCMWTTLGSEAILAVRTYAFLGKNMYLGIALVVLLLGETAFLLYVSIAGVFQIPPPPIPGLDGVIRGPCTASDFPGQHIVSGFWLAPVAFDLICTFLTVAKAVTLQNGATQSPIIRIFIREGVFYFLAVAGVNVLNAAFMFQSNPSLQNINCFLALVLSQVLCCRLVLNLKGHRDTSSQFSGSNSLPSFMPGGSRQGGVSIPLGKYKEATSSYTGTADPFDGVKVQIDVEQHAIGSGNTKHEAI